MRLWSLHPQHLDRIGLVACWREALLAQAVLAGQTRGYRHHPQLTRFHATADPLEAIGCYLTGLLVEAQAREFRFNATKILHAGSAGSGLITVTSGQLAYEWQHLGVKVADRSPADAQRWQLSTPSLHPLFELCPGEIEPWERT